MSASRNVMDIRMQHSQSTFTQLTQKTENVYTKIQWLLTTFSIQYCIIPLMLFSTCVFRVHPPMKLETEKKTKIEIYPLSKVICTFTLGM